MSEINSRKDDHVDLAIASQHSLRDERFEYEPMYGVHPDFKPEPFIFLGKKMNYPFWISSMTGGGSDSKKYNEIFASVCGDLGLGMGLGSCRALLEDPSLIGDFDLRDLLGPHAPFFMNLGIAQVAEHIKNGELHKINDTLGALRSDGLIVHVNPLQEFFQPEGDVILDRPIDIIEKLKNTFLGTIVVKEIGQGMGQKSLKALNDLGIDGLELAGFGGTNFTKLEQIRSKTKGGEFISVGEPAVEMIKCLNEMKSSMDIIISGGMNDPLEAYYHQELCHNNSVIGQAQKVLEMGQLGKENLKAYITSFILKTRLAKNYLTIKH